MKKIATILLALLAFVSVSAQSLYIYKGSVITVVNSSTAGEMTYTPTTLTANGVTYATAKYAPTVSSLPTAAQRPKCLCPYK